MTTIEGICPECALHYHGPGLSFQFNQICFKCGSTLEVRHDGVLVRNAFSRFKAREYQVGSTDQEEWDDLCAKNLLFYLTIN
jgi:hypothetical protein